MAGLKSNGKSLISNILFKLLSGLFSELASRVIVKKDSYE
jgi:hypothetical protein